MHRGSQDPGGMSAPVQLLQPLKPWTDLQEVHESQPLAVLEGSADRTDRHAWIWAWSLRQWAALGTLPGKREKPFPAWLPGRSLNFS